jgi:uncharacterized membrane protein YdbT with pleckstrin-like domain
VKLGQALDINLRDVEEAKKKKKKKKTKEKQEVEEEEEEDEAPEQEEKEEMEEEEVNTWPAACRHLTPHRQLNINTLGVYTYVLLKFSFFHQPDFRLDDNLVCLNKFF